MLVNGVHYRTIWPEGRAVRLAAPGAGARNPSFDVTPAELVTGIVCELGIFVPSELKGAAAARLPNRRS
jgi:methylthioribose-1-phosphate isomerase